MEKNNFKKAKNPFVFFSRLHLRELTGISAKSLPELLKHLKTVPGSVVYCHTHHFLEQHERLVPITSNDFAYWASEVLNENLLGEKLSSIDVVGISSIRELREEICRIIDKALKENSRLKNKIAPLGQDFHFMKTISFVFETPHRANDLAEFLNCIEQATLTSIYYHIFESRLRFERQRNDFSLWLKNELGENELAEKISLLNPYDYSLEQLRKIIIGMVRSRLTN